MERQYAFALYQIAQGRTVLVYHWPERGRVAHVKRADRLSLRDGMLYVDGKTAKGMTVCVKP